MKQKGFTLIEVMIALAVIAIALTALMRATSYDVAYHQRLKETIISHWVAQQGVSMLQLGLIDVKGIQEKTEKTKFLGNDWYWRVRIMPTKIASVQQIEIRVSPHATGPFLNPLIAYRSSL